MAFTDKQRRSLASKLKYRHVKTRSNQGIKISYLEGWHVVAEANRIFGHDNWDRQTLYPRCVWSGKQFGQAAALYSTKVRVTVRAGADVILREGIGTGFGRAQSEETAHEIALKAAETDGTKRALATFGNPFGLALYDKDQVGVTRRAGPKSKPKLRLFVLCRNASEEVSFQEPQAFSDAAVAEIGKIERAEELTEFARRNRGTLLQLRSMGKGAEVLANAIRLVILARASAISQRLNAQSPSLQEQTPKSPANGELAFPKETRIRNKEHLQFVAQQPCLVCGRQPSHAHHIRFSQRRGLGEKVSDEFVVPLCSAHHDELHRHGDERRWWAKQAIDPMAKASQLWRTTKSGLLPGASDNNHQLASALKAVDQPLERPNNRSLTKN